jgi:diacylglycerol kinase (ATP)
LWFGQTTVDKLFLIGSVVLVLLVELLNSAVEAVVDRVGLERHELSGRAKDIGSAAVSLSLAWAAIVWVSLLY